MTGRALEGMPAVGDINSVKQIVDTLRKEIKCVSSVNIESKFTTLRIVKGDVAKFAEEAERLAEDFRRSLVLEGFTKTKASELAIKKTQELCRGTSRNEAAKAVIDGNKFDTPSDVISTFLVQNEKYKKEKKEQDMANNKRQGGKNFKKNYNSGQNSGNKNQKYGNGNKNFRGKSKFNKNKNDNHGGKERKDHIVRLISDTGASSGENSAQNGTEQVFRLAPS